MSALLSSSANILILTVDKYHEGTILADGLISGGHLHLILMNYTKACIKEYINPKEILLID